MREILFRGKRMDCGEWIEGSLWQINGQAIITRDGVKLYKVIPETVGQYIGFDDKNGKNIFDGDYCLLTKPCVMAWGIIKYKKSCYWFVENKVQTDGTYNMIKLCDLDSNGYEIQVKGNIHDNPELLEERNALERRVK